MRGIAALGVLVGLAILVAFLLWAGFVVLLTIGEQIRELRP